MIAVNGYYDGQAFKPLEKVTVQKNRRVIITVLDENIENINEDDNERIKKIKKLRGCFSKYAKTDVNEAMKAEEGAWESAVVEKYGNI
ncbi:MAG: hypothetical protein IKN43_09345 [Selenomonadaceae bacterium]|nr:hypothetical protein [Selenomonadaceae bacterium]